MPILLLILGIIAGGVTVGRVMYNSDGPGIRVIFVLMLFAVILFFLFVGLSGGMT